MISDLERLGIKYLRGLREVVSSLDDRVEEIHGMYDVSAGSLRRINGKLLCGSGGSVRSLAQTRFQGRNTYIIQADTSTYIFTDTPAPPGLIFSRASDPHGLDLLTSPIELTIPLWG